MFKKIGHWAAEVKDSLHGSSLALVGSERRSNSHLLRKPCKEVQNLKPYVRDIEAATLRTTAKLQIDSPP